MPVHIPYRSTPQRDWEVAAVEALIRTAAPIVPPRPIGPTQLGQIGDQGRRRPSVIELFCVLPGGLHAMHRLNEQGVSPPFALVDPKTFAIRQFLAFAASHLLNVNQVPVSFERILTNFGSGSLTAIPVADPFLRVDLLSKERRTVAVRPPHRRRGAWGAAVVFNGLIGSARRFEHSAVCTADGTVLTIDHHEAFTYLADTQARLAAALRADPVVEASLAEALFPPRIHGGATDMRLEKVLSMLRGELGQDPCDRFEEVFRDLRPPKPSFQGVPFTYI